MATSAVPQHGVEFIIQKLLEAPVYLSEDHVRQNVLPVVSMTIAAVSCIYLAASFVADKLIKQPDHKAMRDKRLLAYQITNSVTNTGLGAMGLYYQYFVLPRTLSLEEKIQGQDDLYLLGAVQIGFQIWAIAIGISFGLETSQMLMHHVAVIFASSKSVFLTNGFRYYAPLALGMTELSSVPLSVMNALKNNKEWQDRYPQYYLASRLLFAFLFLFIRIGIFVPQHFEYLKYAWLMTYFAGDHHVGYRLFMFTSWIGAVFLLVLQLYWGYLIVKGISNFLLAHVRIEKGGKKTN